MTQTSPIGIAERTLMTLPKAPEKKAGPDALVAPSNADQWTPPSPAVEAARAAAAARK